MTQAAEQAQLGGSPYQGYTYSYPHKTAYRPLDPPVRLETLWADEKRDALFLYVHVPFCGMRCGFCNLFTRAKPEPELVARYLDTLECQASHVRAALGPARFARFAIGGGTPTYLDLAGLSRVFRVAEETMSADIRAIPASVEISPETVDAAKLRLLAERGVDRVSIGVETFEELEAAAVFRPQTRPTVERALDLLRRFDFPTLNIDLIYGLPGQSVASWLDSVRAALRFEPEELYLYPLYVRPMTGLGRAHREWDDLRLACYREARALLLDEGYQQLSMRMFRARRAPDDCRPVYCCQEDGMVGLGCGARSYTKGLHYGTEYAVGARGVRAILEEYNARTSKAFEFADHGIRLDVKEQRRRYVIQSLLQADGLRYGAYEQRFGTATRDDVPELAELEALGLADRSTESLRLTREGLERSDAIGPWLYSARVRQLMEEYEWR